MDERIEMAREVLGAEFVESAEIFGRVVRGFTPRGDGWDTDLPVAYIESLSVEELQGALFAAGFMLAVH